MEGSSIKEFLRRTALLAGFLAAAVQASAVEFSTEYKADEVPEEAIPAWAGVRKEGLSEIKEGCLVVEVGGHQREIYALGSNKDGVVWGDAQAWSLKGQATLELRLRCTSDFSEIPAFTILIRDDSRQWEVRFGGGASLPGIIDASDWDTYRLTIEDSKLQVSSDRRGVIFRAVSSTPESRGNALLFGSYSSRPDATGMRGWELDFLRWTTAVADFNPPEQEN